MKFILTLKDPDGVVDSVCEAVTNATSDLAAEMTPREYDDLRERRGEELFAKLKKWVEHDEYVRIEIDTIAGAARVLEAPRT